MAHLENKKRATSSSFVLEYSNDLFITVIQSGKLVSPDAQYLGESMYLHKRKINFQHDMVGQAWDRYREHHFWEK